MKVILNQTVPKVGKEGTVVRVADGFARNYLFPRGLAIVAEKKQVEVLERRRAKVASVEAEGVEAAQQLKERIDGKEVRIEGKVGASLGKLFGAITSQDVVEAIRAQLGENIEKRRIALIEPIKRLGRHSVELDLHREVTAHVMVEVFDPNAPVEEPPQKLEEPEAAAAEA